MLRKIPKQSSLDQFYAQPEQLIELFPIPAVVIHRSGVITYVNKRFSDLYLSSVQEMTGRTMQAFSESANENARQYFDLLDQGAELSVQEVFVYGRYYQVLIQPIYNVHRKVEAIYVLKWNISQIKRLQQMFNQNNKRFKEQILLDQMTGVPNDHALEEYIAELKQHQPDTKISVLLIDLDLFGDFNKEHGFTRSNSALYSVAQTLKFELRRENDFLVKLNHDRFMIVFPEVTEYTGLTIAERLRHSIYQLNFIHQAGVDQRLTISIILHTLKVGNIITINHLVHSLGDRLYQNKEVERNRCSVFPSTG